MREDAKGANMGGTVLIDFRGEPAAIVYTGYPKAPDGMDDLVFWFEPDFATTRGRSRMR